MEALSLESWVKAGGSVVFRDLDGETVPARSRVSRARIRPLSPGRAVLALLPNMFNTVVVEPARLARHLDAALWLAARVPVKTLEVPRGLERLAATVDAVAADLVPGGRAGATRRRRAYASAR